MPNKKRTKKQPKPVLSPFVKLLITAFVVTAVLTVSGFTFAATQEQHDSFCASCHTQPESTFYQRSIARQPVDLASAHTIKNVRCIDCHSGPGVTGRMQAELLGAHNALAFYTHTAVQPAVLNYPIADANCLKCHQQDINQSGSEQHFHAFLTRWQAVDPNAGACVSCHSSHTTDGDTQAAYLNQQRTLTVCQDCHNVLGGGD
jgi:predicted CXXCH cytochrome family protein